jgi:hypothetical protein
MEQSQRKPLITIANQQVSRIIQPNHPFRDDETGIMLPVVSVSTLLSLAKLVQTIRLQEEKQNVGQSATPAISLAPAYPGSANPTGSSAGPSAGTADSDQATAEKGGAA